MVVFFGVFFCLVSADRLKLLLSFAVGGLLGDVFLHLLPEAWAHVDPGRFIFVRHACMCTCTVNTRVFTFHHLSVHLQIFNICFTGTKIWNSKLLLLLLFYMHYIQATVTYFSQLQWQK